MIILVAVPSVINSVITRVLDPPLGLGFIAAFLKQHGYPVKVLDFASYPVSLSKISQVILELKPTLVGFTCYNSNYYLIKQIANQLKAQMPSLKIMIGGPTPTFSAQAIFEDTKMFDFIVRGEGERTALDLAKIIESQSTDYQKVEGISYLQEDRVIHNPDRKLEADLDQLPSPYLENVFDMDLYKRGSIITGRGCNQRCMFCNCGIMFGHTIRLHSIHRILSEIDKLVNEYHITEIHFHDDAFSTNISFAKKVLQELILRDYKLKIWMETRIDRIDDELLDLMVRVNVKQINFGLESGDPEILKFIRKVRYSGDGQKPEEKFLNAFKTFLTSPWKNKLSFTYSIIIGHPNETYQHALNTLQFVKLLGEKRAILNILTLVQGTEIWDRKDEFGIKYEPNKKRLFPYKIRQFSRLSQEEILNFESQIPNNLLAYSYTHLIPKMLTAQLLGISSPDQLRSLTRKTFEYPPEVVIKISEKYLKYGDG